MFKRKSLPMGAMVMLLILALATIGVGYGLWSEILTIKGIVKTGEVDVVLSLDEIDQGPTMDDNGIDEDLEVDGNDVAECTGRLLPGLNTLEIEITNGYPSYSCWVEFDVHNVGTIPVIVEQPALGTVPDEITVEFLYCYTESGDSQTLPVNETPQLDPAEMQGSDPYAYCWIHAHVEQEAEENAGLPGGPSAYTFQATVCAHQWNEDASPACTAIQP
jgi:hypothetical protein